MQPDHSHSERKSNDKTHQCENNGGDDYITTRDYTIVKAIWSLVYYELGYGGRVTEITANKISIVTHILGATDKVYFEGSEKDMEPLINAVILHKECCTKKPNELSDMIMEVSNGNALIISHSTPLVMGGVFGNRTMLRAVAIMALDITDYETIKYLLEVDRDTFEPALSLLYEGASLEDLKSISYM